MRIPCKTIAKTMKAHLSARVTNMHQRGIFPCLADVLVGNAVEQASYVAIKERNAHELGIDFKLYEFPASMEADAFENELNMIVQDSHTSAVIVQLPLPPLYKTERIYDIIPPYKEIEGHTGNSLFFFPLSLAVMTGLKYVFGGCHTDERSIVNMQADAPSFQSALKGKRIVIAGRGVTAGQPIARLFDSLGIPYQVTHSQTSQPQELYKQADIIISGVGKKIITPDIIKPGVVLLNVGLRKEGGSLKGDYDECEVKDVASYHTVTPGGIGPIDVLYLYKNVIDGASAHQDHKRQVGNDTVL